MISSKKLSLCAMVLLSTGLAAHAQVKEGRAVYERKINMHRRLTDESMKNMIPEFNTSKSELFFSGDESLFRDIKEEEDIRDDAGKEDGPMVKIKMGGGDAENYRNYATARVAEQRDLGPKKYIIDDSLPNQHWRLQTDTQTIRGYFCRKALGTDSRGNAVIAWYAENILSPAGPEAYGGLPGLIVSIDINNAEITYTLVELSTGAVDKKIVKAPTSGKKITRAAFKKMMEDEFGPEAAGGKVSIRIIKQ